MKRGFYESYKQRPEDTGARSAFFASKMQKIMKDKDKQERQIIVKKMGFGTALIDFFVALMTVVLQISAVVLSSVGLTTLLNKPLRDLFIKMVNQLIFGG